MGQRSREFSILRSLVSRWRRIPKGSQLFARNPV